MSPSFWGILGVMTMILILVLISRVPTESKSPPGPFDNKIYTKPFFKLVTVGICLFFGALILTSYIA